VDPLRPIPPTERTVAAVELTILTPIEREREKQRRERERDRKRRQAASQALGKPAAPGDSGLDVRV
jgi:hypothetical protein